MGQDQRLLLLEWTVLTWRQLKHHVMSRSKLGLGDEITMAPAPHTI